MGNLSKIALLGGALTVPSFGDKVQFEQLPAQLQEKIRAQTGGARIEDIDRDSRNGKTTYEVAFKNAQGQNTELVFEDTGELSGSNANTTLDSRKIKYDELPTPVRRVADSYVSGGEVNDVERNVRNGRVTYGIGYKGLNGTGPQKELLLDQQGNVLRGRRNSAVAASSIPNTTPSSVTSFPNGNVTARTINYNELPQGVRKVAESHLSHGNVERVDRQVQNGEINYTINFKKDDGQYQQMVITEDGRVLGNQLLPASAVGAAAAVQSGTTASTTTQPSQYSNITAPVQMRNSVVMDRSQVPAEVRRAIREHTKNGTVDEILRGDWSGREVYQVSFIDENKKPVELQIDQNGQVIYDPRSNVTARPASRGNILNNIGRALLDSAQPQQ